MFYFLLLFSRNDETECMEMLQSNYKFYLSFENSICDDYITEKFFKILNYNLVPVVLGGGNYARIAPSKSYIDVRDFNTLDDLANYLKYLDANITAYAEYFEWKKHFSIKFDYGKPFCNLCKALNDPKAPMKTYPNIDTWWRSDAHCVSNGIFQLSKTYITLWTMEIWNKMKKYFSGW